MCLSLWNFFLPLLCAVRRWYSAWTNVSASLCDNSQYNRCIDAIHFGMKTQIRNMPDHLAILSMQLFQFHFRVKECNLWTAPVRCGGKISIILSDGMQIFLAMLNKWIVIWCNCKSKSTVQINTKHSIYSLQTVWLVGLSVCLAFRLGIANFRMYQIANVRSTSGSQHILIPFMIADQFNLIKIRQHSVRNSSV